MKKIIQKASVILWLDTMYTYVTDTVGYNMTDTIERTIKDTIYYTPELHRLEVSAQEPLYGKTSGSGIFVENSIVEIAAIAHEGYQFAQWSDGNRDNPRQVTLEEDMRIEALFMPEGINTKMIVYTHDTVVIHDTVWLTTRDTIWMTVHDTVWIDIHDTTNITVRDTLWVSTGERDTIYIYVHETISVDSNRYYSLTVVSHDNLRGVAAGNGLFTAGTVVELGAVANSGYQFVRWSDGATDNPHQVTVEGDISITAYFEPKETENIIEYTSDEESKIAIEGNRIVIEARGDLPVWVYNSIGQPIMLYAGGGDRTPKHHVSQRLRPGIYIVGIGRERARKLIIK